MGRPRHCCAELNTSRIAYKPVFTAPWKVVLSWSLDGISPHYKPILVQIVEVPSHLPVRDMLLKIHEQFPDLPVSEWTSIFYSLLVFGGFDMDVLIGWNWSNNMIFIRLRSHCIMVFAFGARSKNGNDSNNTVITNTVVFICVITDIDGFGHTISIRSSMGAWVVATVWWLLAISHSTDTASKSILSEEAATRSSTG